MNELISVIINVYNDEKHIAKCIESVLSQTYKNIEILIINDGSTDNTLNICKSYKDDRIRIIDQKNIGLSMSRNVGIDNACGEYLYFVDSDDFIEKDTIDYLYGLIKKYNVMIASCGALKIYDYNYRLKNDEEKIYIASSKEMIKKILLSKEYAGTSWNKLTKKELFRDIRFEDRIVNDVVVTYKLYIKAKKIVYSNQIKYFYLRHKESILGKKPFERSKDMYNATLERYEHLKTIYPNMVENEICVLYIITSLYIQDEKELQEFLIEQGAIEVFKKMFTMKVLTCSARFGDKLKIVLFRINPKLCNWIVRKYLKLKRVK